MVPTNSKVLTKGGLAERGRGFTMGILPGRRTGTKPCDVGKEERMRDWLRAGTWRRAQPRGTYSHLVNEVRRKPPS
jgi:hypothetical protein